MPRSTDMPGESRFGVIDIGSHTVRLVVYDGRTRSPAYFFNEKETCALGAEIQATGALFPRGKERALAALKRFSALAKVMQVKKLDVVATAAMRDATDGESFAKIIREEIGLPVRVIDGVEEGRYAAMGVLLGETRHDSVVIDIGGASMEMSTIKNQKIGKAASTPLGPLRLAATGLTGKDLDDYVLEIVEANWPKDAPASPRLTLVGGGWRAFGTLDMNRRDYPMHVLQGYEITPKEAMATVEWSAKASASDLASAGLSATRIANAPLVSRVLGHLIAFAKPSLICISGYGLREGILYDNLPLNVRDSDPLIQSAAFMERMDARFPGFGDELAAWLISLFPNIPNRLLVAACRLADVNWRVHPDYRARACFATATQANLGGLNHQERVFLAVALAYRYKGAKETLRYEPAVSLLDSDASADAQAVGRAIRLGAMLSGAASGILAECRIERVDDELVISVPPQFASLLAGPVERRLKSLATTLGLKPSILIQSAKHEPRIERLLQHSKH